MFLNFFSNILFPLWMFLFFWGEGKKVILVYYLNKVDIANINTFLFLGSTIFLNWEYETIAVEISKDVKNLKKKKTHKKPNKKKTKNSLTSNVIQMLNFVKISNPGSNRSFRSFKYAHHLSLYFLSIFSLFYSIFNFLSFSHSILLFFFSFILLTLFCFHYSFYFVHDINSTSLLIIHVILFSIFLCVQCVSLSFLFFFSINVYLLDSSFSFS